MDGAPSVGLDTALVAPTAMVFSCRARERTVMTPATGVRDVSEGLPT